MIILPAIDIINGQPVRLYQGDYAQKEVVADSVRSLAQRFVDEGACFLHLVDLDGAKAGRRVNAALIKEVAKTVGVPIEVGGGIRTLEDIADYIENGVERVILGTGAMEDATLLQEAVHRYGAQIAVGNRLQGRLCLRRGWLSQSDLHYIDFAKQLEAMGVQTIIADGYLQGRHAAGTEHGNVAGTETGGAHAHHRQRRRTRSDAHRRFEKLDIYGAITGKAVVCGTLDLPAAIALCEEG